VVLLANHEGLPLAATRNGSLTLEQTDAGLEFTATADAADPDAARIAAKVESGLLSECSFAFRVTRQDWNEARDERTLQEIDLNRGDVSVVTFGANPNTAVQMRSMLTELDDDALAELRDDPEMLGLMRRLMPETVIEEEIVPTIITPTNVSAFTARAYALRPRS
jgi:HK97 family phage prohead protease